MPQLPQFLMQADKLWMVILLAAWGLPWKGIALWKASKRHDKKWFAVLLIVNTIGVLEMLYIFYFSRRKKKTENLTRPAAPLQ